MSQVALRALGPIRHDGRDYATGAVFEAGRDAAAVLLAFGAAAWADAPALPEPLPALLAEPVPEMPDAPKRAAKPRKQAAAGDGLPEPEKMAPEAGATPGNGGAE